MPMPLSDTVIVRAALSKDTRILRSASDPYRVLSDRASKRSLSAASEAFETSSRRKISLLLYKEWIIRLRSCLTSAWKPRVSFAVVVGMQCSVGIARAVTVRICKKHPSERRMGPASGNFKPRAQTARKGRPLTLQCRTSNSLSPAPLMLVKLVPLAALLAWLVPAVAVPAAPAHAAPAAAASAPAP